MQFVLIQLWRHESYVIAQIIEACEWRLYKKA